MDQQNLGSTVYKYCSGCLDPQDVDDLHIDVGDGPQQNGFAALRPILRTGFLNRPLS